MIENEIVLIIIIAIFTFILGMIIKEISHRAERLKYEQLIVDLKAKLQNRSQIDENDAIKQFILQIVTDIAIMNFREFLDSHNIEKITRANVRDLVEKVAKEAREVINVEEIKNITNILDDSFYDKYIISSTSMIIKNLLGKEIQIIEEEG